jgi:CspA family cold shock protein
MATITGTVKFFNTTKGFGFISPENGEKDAFVHISAVQRSGLQGLYEGDKVTYELETGRDGKVSATNLIRRAPRGPFLLGCAERRDAIDSDAAVMRKWPPINRDEIHNAAQFPE